MKDTDNKTKTLFHRAVYWLSYNKALLFMIYIAVMVFSSSLTAIRNGEDSPKVQELVLYHEIDTKHGLGLIKQGKTLVAKTNRKVVRLGIESTDYAQERFYYAFDTASQNLGSQSVEAKLKALYQDYLPKLAEFQSRRMKFDASSIAFGVSKYPEVKKMMINGQAVPKVETFIDDDNQTWYIWFYPHLPLKPSGNVIEFKQ